MMIDQAFSLFENIDSEQSIKKGGNLPPFTSF